MQRLRRMIFPDQCLLCGDMVEGDGALCGPCWRDTPFILGLACHLCGAPLPGEAPQGSVACDDCRAAGRAWSGGTAVMLYEGGARRLVLGLKHGDRLDLAPALARWMEPRAAPLAADPATLLAPVPLHWRRLFRRRYNQAAALARPLAAALGRDCCPDLLIRGRATPPQDGIGRDARQQNVAGAIFVPPQRVARVSGRPVLLIDDVMTSGATLQACAEACLDAGAERVCVAVLARVARAP